MAMAAPGGSMLTILINILANVRNATASINMLGKRMAELNAKTQVVQETYKKLGEIPRPGLEDLKSATRALLRPIRDAYEQTLSFQKGLIGTHEMLRIYTSALHRASRAIGMFGFYTFLGYWYSQRFLRGIIGLMPAVTDAWKEFKESVAYALEPVSDLLVDMIDALSPIIEVLRDLMEVPFIRWAVAIGTVLLAAMGGFFLLAGAVLQPISAFVKLQAALAEYSFHTGKATGMTLALTKVLLKLPIVGRTYAEQLVRLSVLAAKAGRITEREFVRTLALATQYLSPTFVKSYVNALSTLIVKESAVSEKLQETAAREVELALTGKQTLATMRHKLRVLGLSEDAVTRINKSINEWRMIDQRLCKSVAEVTTTTSTFSRITQAARADVVSLGKGFAGMIGIAVAGARTIGRRVIGIGRVILRSAKWIRAFGLGLLFMTESGQELLSQFFGLLEEAIAPVIEPLIDMLDLFLDFLDALPDGIEDVGKLGAALALLTFPTLAAEAFEVALGAIAAAAKTATTKLIALKIAITGVGVASVAAAAGVVGLGLAAVLAIAYWVELIAVHEAFIVIVPAVCAAAIAAAYIFAGPVAAAIMAIILVITLLIAHWDKVTAAFEVFKNALVAGIVWLGETIIKPFFLGWGQLGAMIAEKMVEIGKRIYEAFRALGAGLQSIWDTFIAPIYDAWVAFTEGIGGAVEWLVSLITGGSLWEDLWKGMYDITKKWKSKTEREIDEFIERLLERVEEAQETVSGSGIWEELWKRAYEIQERMFSSLLRLTEREMLAMELTMKREIEVIGPPMPRVPITTMITHEHRTVHLYPSFYFTITTTGEVDIDAIAKKVVNQISRYL